MARLKSLAELENRRAGFHAFSLAWGMSCAALCVLAILALLAGCGSGSSPTSAASASNRTAASSALIPAPNGELWGYIHTDGTWAIKAQFKAVGQFNEGLAVVDVGGKWGYINQAGQFVIKPQFVAAYSFQNGLARVATKPTEVVNYLDEPLGTGFGWIDKTGKFVISPTWDDADSFYEGLAAVLKLPKNPRDYPYYGYINMKGEVVIPPKFQNAGEFSEGLAYAMSGGKWGYIDNKGTWVVTPRYGMDEAAGGSLLARMNAYDQYMSFGVSKFHDGYAVVWDAGKNFNTGVAHFIDKTGRQVFGRTFQAAGEFSEGLAAVKVNGKWGFIDTSGRIVIQPEFRVHVTSLPGFSEGLAAVYKQDGEVGYIDKTGGWVIQPSYLYGGRFGAAGDGLAYVNTVSDASRGPDEIVDKSGRVVYRNEAVLSTTSTSAK